MVEMKGLAIPGEFQHSSSQLSYVAYINVVARGPREQGTYACVGCTLAMTMGQRLD
jgi:hypothetical protein